MVEPSFVELTWLPLAGGALIGAAASLLLLTHGRVAGVSGLLAGLLFVRDRDTRCRAGFLGGLVLVGALAALAGAPTIAAPVAPWPVVILAGVLVGFGTRLGNGCTSGHGVCGVARLSRRSLVATLAFVGSGMVTATAVGALGGGP